MKRVTKAEALKREVADYNRLMRRCGMDEVDVTKYLKIKAGKSRKRLKAITTPLEASTLRRASPQVPSGNNIGSNIPKKQEQQYTGDKLLGIGVMHKSNMVPIFKGEDAEDIAKMRRN